MRKVLLLIAVLLGAAAVSNAERLHGTIRSIGYVLTRKANGL